MPSSRNLLLGASLVPFLILSVIEPVEGQSGAGDPSISYKPVPGLSGSLQGVGSDASLAGVMDRLLEAFEKKYPLVNLEATSPSALVPSLVSGQAKLGLVSQPLREVDADNYEKWSGQRLEAIAVGLEMTAVYVHKDNPIVNSGLSLEELDAIFSSSRKRGHSAGISSWGQVGLTGSWKSIPISLYSPPLASGTGEFFQEEVLHAGSFKVNVKEQPGSVSVLQGVASDKSGLGFAGSGFKTAAVAAVPIKTEDGKPITPTPDLATSYPLSRYLLLYVDNRGGDRVSEEFQKFILSKDGQAILKESGFLPVGGERLACLEGYHSCTKGNVKTCCRN